MPRIDILEEDLTRATGTVGTDIPFIPGFSSKSSAKFEAKIQAELEFTPSKIFV